jgi:Fe-S-cluster containining protein
VVIANHRCGVARLQQDWSARTSGLFAEVHQSEGMMQKQVTEKFLLLYVRTQAQKAQQALDTEVAKIPNVCGKGCSACCHQMVYATSWEEELIRHYVESEMFPKVKQMVRKQLVKWWRTFKTMARQSTRGAPLTQYEQAEIQRSMRQQRVRCPFLVDGVCSIYPVRPAVCRAHVVANDPMRVPWILIAMETHVCLTVASTLA